MRSVYYLVGLYLLRVSEDFGKYVSQIEEIHSFYGGNLAYDGGDSLPLSSSRVYYKRHYNRFRKAVMGEIDKQDIDTICFRLDISNYFDSIVISNLLNLLSAHINDSIEKDWKFDPNTIDQIRFFFEFLRDGKVGIPQTDNGIISDMIGHLYLIFGDFFIHDLLGKRIIEKSIQEFQIYRYVDDMYLFIKLRPNISAEQRDSIATNISGQIADLLNKKLFLKCNTKAGYYRLSREEERKILRQTLKKVSPDEVLPDEDDPRSPQERANDILEELRIIKQSELNTDFDYSSKDDRQRLIARETLKNVFDEDVENILNTLCARMNETTSPSKFSIELKGGEQEMKACQHHPNPIPKCSRSRNADGSAPSTNDRLLPKRLSVSMVSWAHCYDAKA